MRAIASGLPTTPEELRASPLIGDSWWYYSVELLPGVVAQGQYPPELPMLPRMMLRRCRLRGASCLDLGTMEGLVPVLMTRGGASRVLAIDGVDACRAKLAAVQHYHGADFEYRTVGPMYSLTEKLGGEGFDLINCSGLLYHVLSPLMVLAGLRGLLKRNGLMIVSTNVVVDRQAYAEFNDRGRLQEESNTFWYLSTGLLDYALRYLRLAPVDCLYQPHGRMRTPWRMTTDRDSGYLSVLCRGTDRILPRDDDSWMAESAANSWEYEWIPDWERANAQPESRIRTGGGGRGRRRLLSAGSWGRDRGRSAPIDLTAAVADSPSVTASAPQDTHTLSLGDRV